MSNPHSRPQEQDVLQELMPFLTASGYAGATITPLRQDVSTRTFYRVQHAGRSMILMKAAPPLEDTRTFAFMQQKLARIGMSVPEIYAADHDSGLVLMEDFGDIRFFELVSDGTGDIMQLYRLAVDGLIHKAKADPAIALEDSVAYSDEYWLFRVEQFLLHYMPHLMKRTPSEEARAEFLALYKAALDNAHTFPPVLFHGDYGVQNLYFLKDRPGVKALGLIDFQDLSDGRGNMMGSPAFDLVFLLQDVRASLPAGLEEEMKQRFIDGMNITDTHVFNREYATIGLAQATKCLGLFARLAYGQGRMEYAPFIAYCWRNVIKNIEHPDLAPIKDWFAKNDIDIAAEYARSQKA